MSSKYILEILPSSPELKALYEKRSLSTDSGVDLFVPIETIIRCGDVKFVSHGIKCRMVDDEGNTYPYYLYPRSSISKTPLMLANSVGIIDKDYRGDIIAAIRYLPLDTIALSLYTIEQNTRLVQICSPDLSPLRVRVVDSLDSTVRGEGGFGSTGK